MNSIDFVVTWVDGSDPDWLNKKKEYTGADISDAAERYRDWDIFHYWFRGVEKFAPWVRKVFLVTDKQCPRWLNKNHPKLVVVDHTDFIDSEYLPTFQSNSIEVNFHKIKDLSEQFVYFNDDIFLIDSVSPDDFFVNGLPCDCENFRIAKAECDFDHMRFNNMEVLNRHFSPREMLKKDFKKWVRFKNPIELFLLFLLGSQSSFSGLSSPHIHISLLKSTYETLWELEHDILHETSTHKVRNKFDVTIWLMRYWQLCSGNFVPKKQIGKLFHTDTLDRNNDAVEYIRKQKGKVICINDCEAEKNFETHKKIVKDALEYILPQKSEFEL